MTFSLIDRARRPDPFPSGGVRSSFGGVESLLTPLSLDNLLNRKDQAPTETHRAQTPSAIIAEDRVLGAYPPLGKLRDGQVLT
jgi:hypothetical protein